jgi:putative peptidoglycan lipid II flippase
MSAASVPAPRGLRHTFVRVGPATLVVQSMSFASSVALATQLGPSTQTDAYYLALSVPALAYAVWIAALRLGGVPALTEIAHHRSPEEFRRSCREVLSATAVAATLISLLVITIMIVVLPVASGGSPRLHTLTRLFMVELSPYMVTGALMGVLGAVLGVRGKFAITTLALGFEPGLKAVLLILFHGRLGAQALVIGSVVGNCCAVMLLWAVLWRDGVQLTLGRFRGSPVVRNVVKVSAPLLISQSVLQFNPLIDRAFAAGLGPGSVTVFELGLRVFLAPVTLLVATLTAPLAATWSARFEERGWQAVTASFTRVIVTIFLLVPPLVALGIVLGKQLIGLMYSSHAYSAAAIGKTASVFAMLLAGLLPMMLIPAFATLFIVQRETVFPMKVGIANCILNAVLDFVLRGPLGLAGIALSTSITLTVLCGVYAWAAKRRWGLGSASRTVWKPAALSFVSAGVIGAVSLLVLGITGPYTSAPVQLAAIGCIGGLGLLAQWGVMTVGAVYGIGADGVDIPGLKRMRMLLRHAADGQSAVATAGRRAAEGR